jgi:hypothetical protein
MSDVTRVVETIFRVTNASTVAGQYNNIGNAAERAGSSIHGLVGAAALLGGAAALGAGVRSLIQMHSQAEGMRQSIAGTLQAFGAVDTFEQGLSEGARVMQQINRDAAALPGSAEDYAAVFRTALPAAMSVGFSHLSEIASFTNQMTAIAIANQEESGEAAMDITRILQGRAGVEVRMWRTIQPLIGKTAEQFNHMDANARRTALLGFVQRYQGTLAHMGDTWDAIEGTTSQYLTQITRAATTPIFDAAKRILTQVNTQLDGAQGSIIAIGQSVSTVFAGGLETAFGWAQDLGHELYKIGDYLSKQTWFQSLRGRVGEVGHSVGHARGGLVRAGGAAIGLYAGGGIGALIGGSIGAFMTHTREFAMTLSGLGRVLNAVVGVGMNVYNVFDRVTVKIGNLLAGILPNFSGTLGRAADIVGAFVNVHLQAFGVLAEWVGDALQPVANGLGALFGAVNQVYDVLEATFAVGLRWVGGVLSDLGGVVSGVVTPLMGSAARLFHEVIDDITNYFHGAVTSFGQVLASVGQWIQTAMTAMFNWLRRIPGMGALLGGLSTVGGALAQGGGAVGHAWVNIAHHVGGAISDELARRRQIATGTAAAASVEAAVRAETERRLRAPTATPAARGGAHTVNDFRHSRFDILQKFAEGFSADRIAVAFSHDLEHAAEHRLQGMSELPFTVNR